MISKALLDIMYSRLYFLKTATHGPLQHDLAIPSRSSLFLYSLESGWPHNCSNRIQRKRCCAFTSLALNWPGSFNFLSLKVSSPVGVTTLTLMCCEKPGTYGKAQKDEMPCEERTERPRHQGIRHMNEQAMLEVDLSASVTQCHNMDQRWTTQPRPFQTPEPPVMSKIKWSLNFRLVC